MISDGEFERIKMELYEFGQLDLHDSNKLIAEVRRLRKENEDLGAELEEWKHATKRGGSV